MILNQYVERFNFFSQGLFRKKDVYYLFEKINFDKKTKTGTLLDGGLSRRFAGHFSNRVIF